MKEPPSHILVGLDFPIEAIGTRSESREAGPALHTAGPGNKAKTPER